MGIYGFLSAAYQETATKAGNIDAQIALVETKRDNVKDQLAVYNAEKSTINGAVSDLRSGLSNNTIQYKDKETGEIITTTSSATRRALEKQLDQAIARQTEINTKVDALNEQLFEYETEIVEIQTGTDLAGELGPLKYLSDPLAIALVIAANYAFEQLKSKTKENIYGEKVVVEEEEDDPMQTIIDNDQEMGLWDTTVDGGLEAELEADPDDLPDLGEFDLNEDGILDENEILLIKKQIQNLEQKLSPGLSGFRANRIKSEIERLKSLLPSEKKDEDDLTITY